MKKTKHEQAWDKEYLRLTKLTRSKGFVLDNRFGVIDANGALNLVRLDFLPVSVDRLQAELEEL